MIITIPRPIDWAYYYQGWRRSGLSFVGFYNKVLSNDVVEGRIRPVAVLRKNVNCMQTERGMQAATASLSLVQTAKLNNMDVRRWLLDYSTALYVHCMEAGWAQAYADGKDFSTKLTNFNCAPLDELEKERAAATTAKARERAERKIRYNMHTLSQGFDYSRWLPSACADQYRLEPQKSATQSK